MPMGNWMRNTNPWLALGAGLYWASYAFRIMGWEPSYMAALGAGGHVFADILAVLWVLAAYLLFKRFGIRRAVTVVAVASVAVELVVAACDILCPQVSVARAVALACGDYFVLSVFCLLWGMAFASLDKRLAAYNVVATLVIATALVLIGQALLSGVELRLSSLCVAVCAAIMASGRVVLRNRKRLPQERRRRAVAGLVSQRFAYGFALGFFPLLATALPQGEVSLSLTLFVLVGLVVVALVTMGPDVPDYTTLPMLVLVCAVALCLPGLDSGTTGVVPALVSGTWLAWQTFSSVQLSDLKDELGMGELDISLVDKVFITSSILVGAAVSGAAEHLPGDSSSSMVTASSVLLGVTCVLVLVSALSLARLVGVHQESDFRTRIERENAERETRQLAAIGDAYGLSARERQVVEMLVRGETFASVAETLGVTYNTAKAHGTHVYQKLGVHGRNEMVKLLEGE